MGARRLTLLRHGEAEPAEACAEDFERSLTRRGVAEAQEAAQRLARRGLLPELILVSPAERAWATAEIIAAACELDAKQVQCARELYLASPETTWNMLAKRGAALQHILICGHNPGLSELASRFGPTPQPRQLPTAGMISAVWHGAEWSTLSPETAAGCELDDPEENPDAWG